MTTYAFPSVTPSEITFGIEHNVASFISPFTGTPYSVGRDGAVLVCDLNYRVLQGADRGTMTGFLTKLNGPQHRFTMQYFAENQQGAFGGTPLVFGADQLGDSLAVDGCSNNITKWIGAGDVFGVNGELKIQSDDADTNGSGEITLDFQPPLRQAPADNAAITTANPTGKFMLLAESIVWTNVPGASGPISSLSFRAIEDPYA
jgi:hypothetical protein